MMIYTGELIKVIDYKKQGSKKTLKYKFVKNVAFYIKNVDNKNRYYDFITNEEYKTSFEKTNDMFLDINSMIKLRDEYVSENEKSFVISKKLTKN